MKTLRFDTAEHTLAIALPKDRMARVIYWGSCLPKHTDLQTVIAAITPDTPSNSTDDIVYTSVLPVDGESYAGMPGLSIRNTAGQVLYPNFAYDSVRQTDANTHIIYTDDVHGLTYTLCISVHKHSNICTLQARLHSTTPVVVDWFSAPVLPAPIHADIMMDFSGRWCAEMQPNTVPWITGVRYRESRMGRSDHAHYPALIVPTCGYTEHSGGVYGLHYGWSGGHRMIAEQLQNGTRQIQFGHAGGSYCTADTQFETAPLYITYTDRGINGMAQSFRTWVRNHLMGDRFLQTPRPVNYNCWESVYFDHNVAHLQRIADKVHALGAERFVLDDGWFGIRNDSSSGLGDWVVNPDKFPDGLTPLVEHVNALGMQFGIWFEPEMINPTSVLNATHPEWVLGSQRQITSRRQWVLNMALPEVQQYLYDKIAHILTAYNVSYIKWDHNRAVPQVRAEHTQGTYALLQRLTQDFPLVDIETCCSGGGRMDYGILQYAKRVWLSDCNDAYERLIMQYNSSIWLPNDIVGAHVGPRTSHSTARTVDMHFRAWVAASRHMGFEMDPNEVTESEAVLLKKVVQWYKDNRDWMFNGISYRLPIQQDTIFPEMTISQNGEKFVVFIGQYKMAKTSLPHRLQLIGLDADASYDIHIANKHDLPWSVARNNTTALHQGTVTLSGATLMQVGIALPVADPGTMMVIEGKKV